MCGYESYAQEGGHCTCADPDFNVVIDPVLFPNGAELDELLGDHPFFAGNAMVNTCLSIDGHLIVNKNFTITGGEIIMAPGAEITVQGSRIFSLVDVDANGGVHGCTRMWRGIRFGGMSARIDVVRSEIRDAQFAINSSVNAGAIYAEDATFWNNYISIRLMPNSIPGPFPVFNGTALELDGNLFSTDGQYLPAYNGQIPDPASSIYTGTGIWAEWANNATIGRANFATNVFEALNFGIYALDSRITVTNCAFLDIVVDPPSPGYFTTARSIHIERPVGSTYPGSVQAAVRASTFDNCQLGIYGRNASMDIIGNSFVACSYAIVVEDPVNHIIRVRNENRIEALSGIQIIGAGPAQEITITGNELIASPAFSAFNFGTLGIGINGFGSPMSSSGAFRIAENYISTSPNPSAYAFGIALQNTTGATVEENPAIIMGGAGLAIGVFASTDTKVAENTVSTVPGTYPVWGALVENSPGTEVRCNKISTTYNCLDFRGMSDCVTGPGGAVCTQISGNELEELGSSGAELYLFNAITSPQEWQGNQWFGVDLNDPADYGAIYIGDPAFATLSKFTTHTAVLPYHPQQILVNDPLTPVASWFGVMSNPDYFQCEMMFVGEGESESAAYKAYAAGGLGAAGYGEGMQWMAERHVYRNLEASPSLLAHPELEAFHQEAGSSSIGSFLAIEQGIAALSQTPADTQAELAEKQNEQEALWETLAELYAAPAPGEAGWEAEKQAAEQELAEIQAYIQQLLGGLEANRLAQIAQLQEAVAAVAAAAPPGQYLKTVYAAWLAHAGGLSWPAETATSLQHIASLCPAEGGDAVYHARAMLGQLSYIDCVELPDLPATEALPAAFSPSAAELAAGIFPNPGRGEFYLQLPDTESGIAEIRIFALDGRLAFQAAVPAGGRSELGLAQLEAGLYFYQVWDGSRRLLDGKLCKVK
jgi:hypothetical protein